MIIQVFALTTNANKVKVKQFYKNLQFSVNITHARTDTYQSVMLNLGDNYNILNNRKILTQ